MMHSNINAFINTFINTLINTFINTHIETLVNKLKKTHTLKNNFTHKRFTRFRKTIHTQSWKKDTQTSVLMDINTFLTT